MTERFFLNEIREEVDALRRPAQVNHKHSYIFSIFVEFVYSVASFVRLIHTRMLLVKSFLALAHGLI